MEPEPKLTVVEVEPSGFDVVVEPLAGFFKVAVNSLPVCNCLV